MARSTHELTVFKFNAGWRRDAYKTKRTAEQEAMLGRIERGAEFRHEELLKVVQSVVDDKLHRLSRSGTSASGRSGGRDP